MRVACANEDCTEFELPKLNLTDTPADQIHCGTCSGPVEEVGAPVEPKGEGDAP